MKACLLHDASEAYISDIVRPVKQHLDTYLVMEDSMQSLIHKKFGLDDLSLEEEQQVKEIDDAMLVIELEALLGEQIADKKPTLSEEVCICFQDFEEVEREFLCLFAL